MARTINRIELLGRVGVAPEMRYTGNDTAVTRLRLATDRPVKDGESVTDWHTVICWGKLGEAVNTYVSKGDRLYVTGRLIYRSYENGQGEKRQQVEVHTQEVVFLDSRSGSTEARGHEDSGTDGELPF